MKRSAICAALSSVLAAALLVPGAATAADCPNEAIRESQTSEAAPLGSTHLPACMAFEMVTPPKKLGQETFRLSAFSANGERALYVSKAALAETEALMYYGGDSYVATRGAAGWTTSPTSPPASALISSGTELQGGPYAFGPDLDAWALWGATQEQKFGGMARAFAGFLGGGFEPLSPPLAAIDDSGTDELLLLAGGGSRGVFPVGTAAGLSATVLRLGAPTAAFLPEDPRDVSDANTYVAFRDTAGQPTVQLLARDETGKVWGGRCGSRLGGTQSSAGAGINQGAISPDGDRIFFSTRPAQVYDPAHPIEAPFSPDCSSSNPLRIMIRTGDGPEIEELLPVSGEAGDDLYQGASVDGSKVFLTTPRDLATSDEDTSPQACSSTVGASKGCDLYLYDAELPEGERLIQVSAGEDVTGEHEAGKEANVLSSIGAVSSDGSRAYFAAQGVLTEDENPEGQSAQLGKPNLYLYDGQVSFIGTLAEGDKGNVWGAEKSLAEGTPYPVPLKGAGPEEGGDGHILFFLSKASLSAEDEDAGKRDVYRYDSSPGTETLQCVSCAPGGDSSPGEAVAGSTQRNTGSNFAELGRWASEDGQTAAFATGSPLVAEDEDDAVDLYLWREGQLAMLPSKIVGQAQTYKLPTVSLSGNQVGFTTTKALLPIDVDATRDAYVVRADGGFPNPPPPPTPCDPLSEGACQGQSSSAVIVQAPATSSFSGPGNQKGPAKCRKGQIRKRGNCVKRRKGQQRKRHKRANHKRGGSK